MAIDDQFSNFLRLRTLKLTSCDFTRFDDFEAFLLKFPQIKNLSLDMVSWPERKPHRGQGTKALAQSIGTTSVSRRSHLRLESLQVGRFCHVRRIVSWILETASCGTLNELAYSTIEPEQLPEVGTLLFRLGSSLRHLTVGCKFDHNVLTQSCTFFIILVYNFILIPCNSFG